MPTYGLFNVLKLLWLSYFLKEKERYVKEYKSNQDDHGGIKVIHIPIWIDCLSRTKRNGDFPKTVSFLH